VKVEICVDPTTKEPYGIQVTARNKIEEVILRRFWDKGIKLNSFTNGGEKLGLTFADLIGT